MSVSKWAYSEVICDGDYCAGDCNRCATQSKALSYKTLLSDFEDARNELCLKCGEYKQAHKGACDGCRWQH